MEERTLRLSDGHPLFFRVWNTEGARATLHILHGMAEHSGLYEDFAYTMAEQGFLVAANDHLGHGTSIAKNSKHS